MRYVVNDREPYFLTHVALELQNDMFIHFHIVLKSFFIYFIYPVYSTRVNKYVPFCLSQINNLMS